jgi:hypothetical protein
MAYFKNKNPNSSTFWRVLQSKKLVYVLFCHLVHFMAIWYILGPFGTFYGYLVNYHRFGIFVP